MRLLVLTLAAAVAAAGCVNVPDPSTGSEVESAASLFSIGGTDVRATAIAGGVSSLAIEGAGDVKVTFPEGVLVFDADNRLLPPEGPVDVGADGLRFVPPSTASAIDVTVEANGESSTQTLTFAEGDRLVSGELAVELMKVQREQFPHRTPGHPNYEASMEYFAAWFEDLGYEVEVNTYEDVKLPDPRGTSPNSLASVVAYKRGTGAADRYIGFGGHFDVVEQTTEGAFDNTAGAMATMAVAKAFQDITTEHTMFFALWGGEEDGILGSQAWITAHPELVPVIDAYVNFDVTALAYPAPANDPARVIVAAGPDGPTADTLHAHAETIRTTWMQTEAEYVLEGVAEGQAVGGGVNAQSDHTPFMARGIPVYFQFTERVGDVLGFIHSEMDTLENMTKYSLSGLEGVGVEFTAEEMAEGEKVLARSFETQMDLGFYFGVLFDGGVMELERAPAGLLNP